MGGQVLVIHLEGGRPAGSTCCLWVPTFTLWSLLSPQGCSECTHFSCWEAPGLLLTQETALGSGLNAEGRDEAAEGALEREQRPGLSLTLQPRLQLPSLRAGVRPLENWKGQNGVET